MRNSRRGGRGHPGWWRGWQQGWGCGPWGVFLLVVLIVVVVGALLLAFIPGLTGYGMMGRRGGFCPWCGGRGTWSAGGFLWTLLLLALPVGLVVLLILGGLALARSRGEGPPAEEALCPACGEPVADEWAVCPYCSEELRR